MSQKRIILSDHHSTGTATGFLLLDFFLKLSLTTRWCCMGISVMKDHPMVWLQSNRILGRYQDRGRRAFCYPVFDKVDDLSKTIAAKYEAGTLRAASIGIRILATSSEKEYLLPGQTRETVTKAEIMEASIVDIPANSHRRALITTVPPPFYWQRVWTRILCQH